MKLLALLVCTLVLASLTQAADIVSARLETCGGWRLNRLPLVKKFINDFLPLYDNIEIKYLGGIDPVFLFFDAAGSEVERLPIAEMSDTQICDALEERGFTKKSHEQEEEEEEDTTTPDPNGVTDEL